jgi:Flp pilus assembly protein TadD
MIEAGLQLLESIQEDPKNVDADLLAAMAGAKLQRGMVPEGMALLRQAAEKQPRNVVYAFWLGLAISRSNDLVGAVQPLSRAIDLDPSRKEPYIALCTIYEKQGRLADKAATIDRYLQWNPQSISFRLQRPQIDVPKPGP